jgi:hypothetical protein
VGWWDGVWRWASLRVRQGITVGVVALALGGVVLASGCGGSAEQSDSQQALTKTQQVVVGDFLVSVPGEWRAGTADGRTSGEWRESIGGDGVFLHDPAHAARAVTFSILGRSLLEETTQDELIRQLLANLEGEAETYSNLKTSAAVSPHVRGTRVEWTVDRDDGTFRGTQYVLMRGKRVWIVTYEASADELADHEAQFAASAESMRITPGVYHDATGDADDAPDITTVTVKEPMRDAISFAIRIANREALGPTDLVTVDLDTDLDPATGDDGYDFSAEIYGGQIRLWKWAAKTDEWEGFSSTTIDRRWTSKTLTVRISATDIGSPRTFDFSVHTDANPDDLEAATDDTPEDGLWRYQRTENADPVDIP